MCIFAYLVRACLFYREINFISAWAYNGPDALDSNLAIDDTRVISHVCR